jgi:hypothetical protein
MDGGCQRIDYFGFKSWPPAKALTEEKKASKAGFWKKTWSRD